MSRKILGLTAALTAVLLLAACLPKPSPPTETPLPVAVEEQAAAGDTGGSAEEASTDAAANSDNQPAPPAIDSQALFDANGCANCHGADRQGQLAPALLPETLTKDPSIYVNTITNGRNRMPAFGEELTPEEIEALVQWLMTPAE